MFSIARAPERIEIPSLNSRSAAYNAISPLLDWFRDLLPADRTLAPKGTSKSRVSEDELDAFRHLVAQAHEIHKTNPAGLRALVTAILRPMQSEQILSVAERVQHGAAGEIAIWKLFSNDSFFSMFEECDCLRGDAKNYRVKFSRDIVLTTPWRRDRFTDALAFIGEGKKLGTWEQDGNHSIALILPWNFGIVNGGNHSIAAGILSGEGEATPTEVHDLTPLLSRVHCDGEYYIDTASQVRLAPVSNYRMAALYEIGRIIIGAEKSTA
jgi:hypothetical protein